MCLSQINEERQLEISRRRKKNSISTEVDQPFVPEAKPKHVLDYIRFGTDYLVRRALEAVLDAAYKLLWAKRSQNQALSNPKAVPAIDESDSSNEEEVWKDAPQPQITGEEQCDSPAVQPESPDSQPRLRHRRRHGLPPCSCTSGLKRSAQRRQSLDVEAEEKLVSELCQRLPTRTTAAQRPRSITEKYASVAVRDSGYNTPCCSSSRPLSACDSGIVSCCSSVADFDDIDDLLKSQLVSPCEPSFSGNTTRSNSTSDLCSQSDNSSSLSLCSQDVDLCDPLPEQSVPVSWEVAERIPDRGEIWRFTDPSECDLESDSECELATEQTVNCNQEEETFIDFKKIEITRAVPVIPSFEIVEFSSDYVTVSFSKDAIEQLKEHLLTSGTASVGDCSEPVYTKVLHEETSGVIDLTHHLDSPDLEAYPGPEYVEFELDEFGNSEKLTELEAQYNKELDALGELSEVIQNLSLFETLEDFRCEDLLTPSSLCNRFEKASESDLHRILGKYDSVNKSPYFRVLLEDSLSEDPVSLPESFVSTDLPEENTFDPLCENAHSELQLSESVPQSHHTPPSSSEELQRQDAILEPPDCDAAVLSAGSACHAKLETPAAPPCPLLPVDSAHDNAHIDKAEVVSGEASVPAKKQTCDVGTLTDLHSEEHSAEVNLVSLVGEQIPRYRLRADTLTHFGGYENEDWVRTPALPPDTPLDLSPALIKETLKYFVLCSERVSQMTKTYNDIDAVTKLLEEKERDLELAARLGQALLEKNGELAEKIAVLEEQNVSANERIAQLRYEVSMKDSLLQVYNENYEAEICPTPSGRGGRVSALDYSAQSLELLQSKVKDLERQNSQLIEQTATLSAETADLEEQEDKLVGDCVRHLDETQRRVAQLEEELATKSDVCVVQRQEITELTAAVIASQNKLKKAACENQEFTKHLAASQEAHKELTREIAELEERYSESSAMLSETQEELRHTRKRAKPRVIHQHYGTSSFFMPHGSLAMELETSQQEVPDGYSVAERSKHTSGVFRTARCVRRSSRTPGSSRHSQSSISDLSAAASDYEDDVSTRSLLGSSRGFTSDAELVVEESAYRAASGMFGTPSADYLGKPGLPGSNTVETAVQRLAVNMGSPSTSHRRAGASRGDNTPTPCNTPASYLSTSGVSSQQGGGYRVSEKLQIVKPLEGSQTLGAWRQLAEPRMDGLLMPRPGVHSRGDHADSNAYAEQIYSLSDCEEDDELQMITSASQILARARHPSKKEGVRKASTAEEPQSPSTGRRCRPSSLSLTGETPGGATGYSSGLGVATTQTGLDPALSRRAPSKRELLHKVASWIASPIRLVTPRAQAGGGSTAGESTVSRADTPSSVVSSAALPRHSQTSQPRSFLDSEAESEPVLATQTNSDVSGRSRADSAPLAPEDATAMPEKLYLNLVAKVKELGLTHAGECLAKSRLSKHTPGMGASYDPTLHVGLNTMMTIRRNRRPPGPLSCDTGSVFNLRDMSGAQSSLLEPGVLTKAASLECLARRPASPRLRRSRSALRRPRLLPEYVAGSALTLVSCEEEDSPACASSLSLSNQEGSSHTVQARSPELAMLGSRHPPTPRPVSSKVGTGTVHSPAQHSHSVSGTGAASPPGNITPQGSDVRGQLETGIKAAVMNSLLRSSLSKTRSCINPQAK